MQGAAQTARFSYKKTLGILAALALLIGGALSLAASAYPDGLEWSIERVTGSTELEAAGTGAYETAEKVQTATALLPDYAFKDSETCLEPHFPGLSERLLCWQSVSPPAMRFVSFKRKKHKVFLGEYIERGTYE